jgi:hypothetical protein
MPDRPAQTKHPGGGTYTGAEPSEIGQSRTDMRSTLTLTFAATVLAIAACGTNDADDADNTGNTGNGNHSDHSDEPSEPDPTDGLVGQKIDAELVLLADSVEAVVAPPVVLADPTSVRAYPGWYASEPDLYAQVNDALAGRPDYPNAGSPLVAFTSGPSCSKIDEAELRADGTKVYATFEGRDVGECLATHTQVAIFAVDRAQLPPDFTLVGTDSADAAESTGPGELIAFEKLDVPAGYQPPKAQELTDGLALDAFASALPSDGDRIRALADGLAADQRVLGFVITGGMERAAELVVTPHGVSAAPVGGEAVRCLAPEFYAAVFAVDPQHLPQHVTLLR